MDQHERERAMHTRREQMVSTTRDEVTSILTLAGLRPERMWELANGYWPLAPDYDDVRSPWWLAQTSIGLIRIGNRKRVMSIEWDACQVRGVVTTDDVTKGETMVHAWTTAKAVEYLTRLREMAEVRPVEESKPRDGNDFDAGYD
jgi:hypothetical protein